MTAPMPPYKQYVREQSASSESLVEVERSGDSAVMRLGDPDKLNVLSAPLMLQLLERTEQLVRDDEVRSIVLTGRGHAFSAGGDLRMMEAVTENLGEPNEEEGAFKPYQWIRYQFGAMVRLIARSDKAFIAAINGPAAGVGLAFALTCDIAVASRDAILVPAFGRLGLVPEVGTSWARPAPSAIAARSSSMSPGSSWTPSGPPTWAWSTRWWSRTSSRAERQSGASGSRSSPRTRSRSANRCCVRRPTPAGNSRWRWRSSPSRRASRRRGSRTGSGR